MNKMGLFLLSLCVGLVAGLILGYVFFHDSGPQPALVNAERTAMSDSQQFFYRLNDSLLTRHTIRGSESGVIHRVDTVAVGSHGL